VRTRTLQQSVLTVAIVVAMVCLAYLPGAVGAVPAASASAAAAKPPNAHDATRHQTPAKGTTRHVCRRRHNHRRCLIESRKRKLARAHKRTIAAPATPAAPATGGQSGGAARAANPSAPQTGGIESGIPTTPPSELPPPGESSNPQSPAHVQVRAKEFSFTLSRPTTEAGSLVIELVNAGQDEHDLHIRPATGGADVGAISIVQPDHHSDVQFNLAPGSYTFYCSMPGHEQLGMKATFTVQ
jgi:plastocyanin